MKTVTINKSNETTEEVNKEVVIEVKAEEE
jgi:hypothetical protein